MKQIGLENLPNLYISEIEVLPPTKRRKRFKIEMIAKDERTRGKFSWYGSDDLGKYLQIMIVCSANQTLNDRLDNGQNPFDKDQIRRFDRSDNVAIFTKSIKQNEVDDRYELIDNKKVYSFIYDQYITLPITAQNVKVYCAIMLDTRMYSNEQGIDLLGPLVSSYSGPVASETILQNGSTVTNTTVLLDRNRNTYSGPYHRHSSGRLMEGSFHTRNPHSFLTEQQAPNMKMKSYIDLPLSIRRNNIRGSRKVVSELTTSYNQNGAGSLFSLDIRNLLITKTLRGKVLASVNPYLFNKAVQKVRILKMQIFEEKLQTKVLLSKIGTKQKAIKRKISKTKILSTRDAINSTTIQTITKNNKTIREVILSDQVDIRNFILEQNENYSQKGERRYTVQFEIFNPIENMVLENYQELLQGFRVLKAYYYRSNLPNNTTSNNRRYTQAFVDRETQRADNLNTSIQYYIEAYSIFNSLTDQEEIEMSQNIMALIRPEYATPKSLAWFFRKYQILLNFYKRTFRIRERKNSDVGSRGNTSKNGAGFRVFVNKTFKDTISFEKTKNMLNFLDTNEPMPILTTSQFRSRYTKEGTKFLSSRPNFISTELYRNNRNLARNMSRINEYLPSYLTPMQIVDKNNKIDLTTFESLKESRVLKFYRNILTNSLDKTLVQEKPKKQSKLRIKRPKKTKKDNFKPVTENLGDNSSFINAEESYLNSKTLKLPESIKNLFSAKDLPKKNFKDFSINNDRLRRMLLAKPEMAVKIPISIKTVMISENPQTKNSEILSKTNYISNPKTFPAFDIFYNTPVSVEYSNDGKTWNLLTQSIFSTLNENVVCRLKYYNFEGLTYKKQIPIANQYFILAAGPTRNNRIVFRNNNVDNAKLLNLTQAVSNYDLTYSTSNIISQPIARNTAFGTRGEASAQEVTINTQTATQTTVNNSSGGGGSYA